MDKVQVSEEDIVYDWGVEKVTHLMNEYNSGNLTKGDYFDKMSAIALVVSSFLKNMEKK